MPRLRLGASLWLTANANRDTARYPTLHGHVHVDVAIVGGGIVGITTALLLQEQGARVVLLDADLPGVDVPAVLRTLSRDRVLERTRVIVLTVRSHESEVVQALDEGAFDHVAKPFSVPILLQRVRRAMRA
jgi:DNA-binding response OmpR family regulator